MVDCRYGKQDSRLACLCRSPKKPSRQSFIHREVNIRREDSSSTIRNDLPSVCLYKSTFIFDFLFFHPVFPLWFCSDMNGLCIILSNFDLFSFFFCPTHSNSTETGAEKVFQEKPTVELSLRMDMVLCKVLQYLCWQRGSFIKWSPTRL